MEKPWFRQFWPWFLILLPSTVIIWTLGTVVLFSQHSVSLVSEDYYKEGRAINQDISKLQEAKALGLNALVSSDNNELTVVLERGKLEQYPALKIKLAHRTLAEKDIEQLVSSDAQGVYRLVLDDSLQGPWFVKITSFDSKWILQGKVNFPTTAAIALNSHE